MYIYKCDIYKCLSVSINHNCIHVSVFTGLVTHVILTCICMWYDITSITISACTHCACCCLVILDRAI